jgi:tRNA (cmo5U34)-methyltransferase
MAIVIACWVTSPSSSPLDVGGGPVADVRRRLGFQLLAPCYDALAAAVYGDATHRGCRRQVAALSHRLPPGARILLVGPGTGRGLEPLSGAGFDLAVIEGSAAMLRRCRRRLDGTLRPVARDLRAWEARERYDAIITPYVLDCFAPTELAAVWQRLHRSLRPGGWWLHVDFAPPRARRHALLLAIMLVGFRFLCGITAHTLADADTLFRIHGYRAVWQDVCWDGFIRCRCWRRRPMPRKPGHRLPDRSAATGR